MVLEEDALLWEDRRMDSHSVTSYVPVTISANVLGYSPGFIHTHKIHVHERCSVNMCRMNGCKNEWLHVYFICTLISKHIQTCLKV